MHLNKLINQQINTEIGTIYLWKVDDYALQIQNGIPKRQIEKNAILSKLAELGYKNSLHYLENGQPKLINSPIIHISISHSNEWMSLYIADQPVGVDIEFFRSSIKDGKSYFINEIEDQLDYSISDLQLIWGAKEAFYKSLEGKIEDLKNEVCITNIDTNSFEITLEYNNQEFILNYSIIENFFMVYTTKKPPELRRFN